MTHIPITLFTAAVLGILCVVLSFRVSLERTRTKVLLGDGAGDPNTARLQRCIRAQGNFVEYVPLALILLAGVEVSGASRLTCEIYSILLIVARIAHPIGIGQPRPNVARAAGAMLTWLVILGLSIEALLLLPRA